MKKWEFIILNLFIALSLRGYVYMFTENGDIYRTSDGTNFQLISNINHAGCVSLTFGNESRAFMLTSNGDILTHTNDVTTWYVINSLPNDDAVEILYKAGNFYILTESGDFYSGNNILSLNLMSSINSNDCVSLAISDNFIFVLTRNGDIWRSNNGIMWERVGNTGSTNMVAVDLLGGHLYAVNLYGDIMESTNNGESWVTIESVSQTGVADMITTSDNLMLLCFYTGELMRKTESGWVYSGTASQSGIKGLSAKGIPTIVNDRSSNLKLRVFPNVTSGIVTIESNSRFIQLYDLTGRLIKTFYKRDELLNIDISYLNSGIYYIKDPTGVYSILKY